MMPYEDIQIQLVDTPPIHEDTESWVYHLLRVADYLLLVLDLADDDIIVSTESYLPPLPQEHPAPAEGELPARPVQIVGCKLTSTALASGRQSQ